MALLAHVGLAAVSSFLAVAILLPFSAGTQAMRTIMYSLAVAIFIGFTSCLWFANRLLASGAHSTFLATEVALAAVLLVLAWRSRAGRPDGALTDHANAKLPKTLLFLVIFLALQAVAFFAVMSIEHPHGDWDSLMIWNLHARFLFRLGEEWTRMFPAVLFWSHPDYPLLLPGFIASIWSFAGTDSPVVPCATALAFAVTTVALLSASVAAFSNKISAALAACLLLSTPLFQSAAALQTADVPMSCFLLATAVLFLLCDRFPGKRRAVLFLAGLTCGFAAWLKNEGMLLALVALLCRFIIAWRKFGAKTAFQETAWLTAGLCLPMACVLYFKAVLAPPSDIFGNLHGSHVVASLFAPHRYLEIAKYFFAHLFMFGNWTLTPVPFLILLRCLSAKQTAPRPGAGILTINAICAGMCAGLLAVYLIYPGDIDDLRQRMFYSIDRLFLQLWPCVILSLLLSCDLETPIKAFPLRKRQ